jgi:hypothetical protein
MEDRLFFVKDETLVVLYCPECQTMLYEMPTLIIEGIIGRVARKTARGHMRSYQEQHIPEYITLRLKPKNG